GDPWGGGGRVRGGPVAGASAALGAGDPKSAAARWEAAQARGRPPADDEDAGDASQRDAWCRAAVLRATGDVAGALQALAKDVQVERFARRQERARILLDAGDGDGAERLAEKLAGEDRGKGGGDAAALDDDVAARGDVAPG